MEVLEVITFVVSCRGNSEDRSFLLGAGVVVVIFFLSMVGLLVSGVFGLLVVFCCLYLVVSRR